jgi:hypothetical protein
MHLQRNADGSVATPNPYYSGTPQPFHAPSALCLRRRQR